MAADPAYKDHVLELLADVEADVRAKAMFGGYGLYADGTMFALITSDDELHLKADEGTSPRFEAAGGARFATMPYWSVPAEVLEDRDALTAWAEEAVAVARGGAGAKR